MSIPTHPHWKFVNATWEQSVLPALEQYIRIPALSPAFDAQWRAHGHMRDAVTLVADWIRELALDDCVLDVVELEGRTPLVWMEVPGTRPDAPTVMLYGHIDKQPPFDGWRAEEGLGPWTPKLVGERLYGRGSADDGYAAFASATAVKALQHAGADRPRVVGLFECTEESGSPDLPAYVDHLADRIGEPALIVCLDSGCGDYERMWWTTSLRGMVAGELHVAVLDEGMHSGQGTGLVPSSFRIARLLLDRLEDVHTGTIRLRPLHASIPELRIAQARQASAILGPSLAASPAFSGETRAVSNDATELILNRTWRPGLEIIGAAGLPSLAESSSTLRPSTTLKLSFRLAPTADAAAALAAIKEALESDPPYGATVRFKAEKAATGWQAPAEADWLMDAMTEASLSTFGHPPLAIGEGGSIPFMSMLGERFPKAQFLVTGVLGPESNAHGPNEFLHVPTAKRLTAAVCTVLERVARDVR